MDNLTLKRGSGWIFDGENWKLVSEDKWEILVLYVPNGKEKYYGSRILHRTPVEVFRCLDDGFLAQPTEICKLEKSDDLLEVFFTLEMPEIEEKQKPDKKSVQGIKVLTFTGKNWKLTSDSKWKSVVSFSTHDPNEKVGEKTIGQTNFDIYKTSNGFIAMKKEN